MRLSKAELRDWLAAWAKNKVKYTCPVCGMNVWGKHGLAVACLRDETPLVETPLVEAE